MLVVVMVSVGLLLIKFKQLTCKLVSSLASLLVSGTVFICQ